MQVASTETADETEFAEVEFEVLRYMKDEGETRAQENEAIKHSMLRMR